MMKEIIMNRYVVVDIETTGTHFMRNEIIEIGAVLIENGKPVKRFNELVCPKEEISEYITSITHIDNEMVKDAPPIEEVMPRFLAFCEDVPLVGQNIILFDYRMLKVAATKLGYPFEKKGVDTLVIARKMLADLPSRKLGSLCEYYGIDLENAHRAYDDAYATYEVYRHLEEDFGKVEPKLFVPTPMKWDIPKWEPITAKQKSYLAALCHAHNLTLELDVDKLSKSEASKTIDKIISQHGKLLRG